MTEAPKDPGSQQVDKIEFEHRSFFQLVSRKTLIKVAMLLVLLWLIVVLKQRSANIAKGLAESLVPPQDRVTPTQPVRQAPTVRMAPMPDPRSK